MVTDPEIASTLLTVTDAQAAADRLIELANENGGADNVTAIVIQVVQKSQSVLDRLKVWKRNSG
jgi:serine/threonine protein phosphatase PrpC